MRRDPRNRPEALHVEIIISLAMRLVRLANRLAPKFYGNPPFALLRPSNVGRSRSSDAIEPSGKAQRIIELEAEVGRLRDAINFVEGVLSRDPFDDTERRFVAEILRGALVVVAGGSNKHWYND